MQWCRANEELLGLSPKTEHFNQVPRPKSPGVDRKTQAVYAQIAFILHSIFANPTLLLSTSEIVLSDRLNRHSIHCLRVRYL